MFATNNAAATKLSPSRDNSDGSNTNHAAAVLARLRAGGQLHDQRDFRQALGHGRQLAGFDLRLECRRFDELRLGRGGRRGTRHECGKQCNKQIPDHERSSETSAFSWARTR